LTGHQAYPGIAVCHLYCGTRARYRLGFLLLGRGSASLSSDGWCVAIQIAGLAGRFSAPRSFGEKPILASKPINNEVSADFCLSLRCAAINVAAISTKNLSALVNQKPRCCISSHADLTGCGRVGGGPGSAVVTSGSFFRSLFLFGLRLNAPSNSSIAVGFLGRAIASSFCG
jgi:hypothetical protein